MAAEQEPSPRDAAVLLSAFLAAAVSSPKLRQQLQELWLGEIKVTRYGLHFCTGYFTYYLSVTTVDDVRLYVGENDDRNHYDTLFILVHAYPSINVLLGTATRQIRDHLHNQSQHKLGV